MKFFLILVGVVAAGILGYLKEPGLRYRLTGISPKSEAPTTRGKEKETGEQVAVLEIDPASLRPEQLPAKVKLTDDVKVRGATQDITMTIEAGSLVKLERVRDDTAVIRPGESPYTLSIPISKTDLIEQLTANPPSAEAIPEPAPADEPAPEIAPTPEPAPELAEEPEATPAPEMTAEPEVAEEPETAPEPEIAPEPAPAPETAQEAAPSDVVGIMQASLRDGQIKEFTSEQVQEWTPGADETIDGEAFQTGMVSYQAETIFGVKTIQAKALIKDGKVQRWIWPKSGMEIK